MSMVDNVVQTWLVWALEMKLTVVVPAQMWTEALVGFGFAATQKVT